MYMLKIFVFFLSVLIMGICYGQKSGKGDSKTVKTVSIGDTIPEELRKRLPIRNSSNLIILDFWSIYCGSCIEAFPHLEKLQQKFANEVQIILVNATESDSTVYQKFRQYNLSREPNTRIGIPASLTSINGFYEIRDFLPYTTVPHHVWVNKSGKVLAITDGFNTTEQRIKTYLSEKTITLHEKNDLLGKTLVQNGIIRPSLSEMPPIYYSAFMPFFQTNKSLKVVIDTVKNIFRLSIFNMNPVAHFQIAFEPSYSMRELDNFVQLYGGRQDKIRTVVEICDTTLFKRPADLNQLSEWKDKTLFTYEMQGHLRVKNKWQTIMQVEVNQFFKNTLGISGRIEKRKYSSLVVKRLVKDALLSKGGIRINSKIGDTRVLKNEKFESVMDLLNILENMQLGRPVINETEITYLVDLDLTGDLTNLYNVKTQLNKQGIDIVEELREIDVLVIRDIGTKD